MKTEPKKLLIITYYWPPAGGPGVQRWLKFVKYLPDFGIQPIVYIPENPTYPILDEKLKTEVSEKAIILKNKIFEPYQLASLFSKNKTKNISSGLIPKQRKQTFLEKCMLWVRGNLFVPDARVYWVKPSVKYLKKYIKENNIDTIITTGPPHSLHLIGLQLKKELQLKWIADFRDPWTTIGYHKVLKLSAYAEKKHKRLEHSVLNTADHIIVTSKTTKTEFEVLTSKPIEVITNGYDVNTIDKQTLDKKFTLSHIGSFLSERNPVVLWEVLSELISKKVDFGSHFQLNLIGKTSNEVLDSISKFGLERHLNLIGYVSHGEAIVHQKKSQILLLIEIDSTETKCIIPGKLFEYMASERPIIAIGPKESDIEEIITSTKTGIFHNHQDKEKLKQTILDYFNLFLENKLQVTPVGLDDYSRKKLTEKLVSLLNT